MISTLADGIAMKNFAYFTATISSAWASRLTEANRVVSFLAATAALACSIMTMITWLEARKIKKAQMPSMQLSFSEEEERKRKEEEERAKRNKKL